MSWLRDIFRLGTALGRSETGPLSPGGEELGSTQRTMVRTLVYALDARNPQLEIIEHSALVSRLASLIAERVGVTEGDRYLLRSAAQLHEIGMLTVPAELLVRSAPLTRAELERVRSQAAVGAEIVRAAHHPRVALLVENQYLDYRELQRDPRIGPRDLLLAGILRVADVITAVTWPRPYQDPMPASVRDEVLRSGAGTRFHPLAVHFALQLPPNDYLAAG